MKTELFNYTLPEELIAYHPPKKRDGGRLLVLGPNERDIDHKTIWDLPDILPQNALLVANDTKVIWARLKGHRPTGGKVETLLVRAVETDEESCLFTALAKSNKPLQIGNEIDLSGVSAQVVDKDEYGQITLRINASKDRLYQHLENRGEVPLPPYIKRSWEPEDKKRYQTVYARSEGSVAAPTAGLHFTHALLEKLKTGNIETIYLTLHVGPGTFRPVQSETIVNHRMDEEQYIIGQDTVDAIHLAKTQGRPVIAVGTTATRALEGAFAKHGELKPGSGFTDLFITPGFSFHVIDGLMTNFHLPKSTLLCLVSALAGRERILTAYEEAVKKRYHFYSYGDAMLILPPNKND
ncbi:MAG: tRNA preQ1(34) S-adenosylmethionine ribosyltransferase-isomerase QueA [Proteobacteria bacterium]|nr:tRNA preQ1(34) S-adenosylmethionine ribosyltransferase-isomerase QueA [Pseudomonadota bacterium]